MSAGAPPPVLAGVGRALLARSSPQHLRACGQNQGEPWRMCLRCALGQSLSATCNLPGFRRATQSTPSFGAVCNQPALQGCWHLESPMQEAEGRCGHKHLRVEVVFLEKVGNKLAQGSGSRCTYVSCTLQKEDPSSETDGFKCHLKQCLLYPRKPRTSFAYGLREQFIQGGVWPHIPNITGSLLHQS